MSNSLLRPSSNVRFADVAHQTLLFDSAIDCERAILELLDTPWVQRLRRVSQTGNTRLVYMFAEHSRFGHSLGVAFLATSLMRNLKRHSPEKVATHETAVAAAALLHDVGHVAPGSHLGERIWSKKKANKHEYISTRVTLEDDDIRRILDNFDPGLAMQVVNILGESPEVPPWTKSIISGGGWNADRGNWAIVDSAMCAVSYGRYNVAALIDSFRISDDDELVLLENRTDALVHFFVARDSMYRQVYQHRVLQSTDAHTACIIKRLRALIEEEGLESAKERYNIFCDQTMSAVVSAGNYSADLSLDQLFTMTESWWQYHIDSWCCAEDPILKDLSLRLRDRRLLKTIRLDDEADPEQFLATARDIASNMGYDPEYYVILIREKGKHRAKSEDVPLVLLDNGTVVPATEIEPMIHDIMKRAASRSSWLAVPAEVKQKIGRLR